MFTLSVIQTTVIQIAEAITEALGIETEIVDHELKIIGGTGRYKNKIGTYEEEGNLKSSYIYSKLLQSGEEYINLNPSKDPEYNPQEGEMAELCYPIKLDNKVIGLIGLIAFTDEQREKIIQNQKNLFLFLNRMAYLLASKLAETKIRDELTATIESIHDGIISVNQNLEIISCNYKCQQLLGKFKNELMGSHLSKIWPHNEVLNVIASGVPAKDREEIYEDNHGNSKHFLSTIMPIMHDANHNSNKEQKALGAVISFQDISEVRTRIYNMTQQHTFTSFEDIIGNSQEIMDVKKRAFQVSSSDSTILITGESGTGKELLARSIHNASPRKDNSFISINCGAIPETLLESELFGYEAGAFSGADKRGKSGKFELADKGTIFLDEIGDMPLHLQVKLLHVLQNKQLERLGGTRLISVDVRIIAATNKNLEKMIEANEFREDLFFRLNVIPIHIPPIRQRQADLEILLDYALNKFNTKLNKRIINFSNDSLNILLNYEWPGNVRELENIVEYAVNMENSDYVQPHNLPERIRKVTLSKEHIKDQSLKDLMDTYQKKIIEDCLKETGYTVEGKIKAAQLLEISESTLYRRIRELGISSG